MPVRRARPTRSTRSTCKRRSPRSTSSGTRSRGAGDGARVPVLGSGHPLADVFLLKYAPQAAEVQEGVAFYGRAGQAILKSLQRLRVDPMAVYGTNCLKFARQDEDEARAVAHARAAHRPAEARRRHGRAGASRSSTRSSSRSRARSRPRAGELQQFTPTIEALVTPGHRRVARRAAGEDRVLERLQAARPVVGRAPAVLSRARAAALAALARARGARRTYDVASRCGLDSLGRWSTSRSSRSCCCPAVLRPRLPRAATPVAPTGWSPSARRLAGSLARRASARRTRDLVCELRRSSPPTTCDRLLVPRASSRSSAGSCSSPLIIPCVDAFSVWRGPTNHIVNAPREVFSARRGRRSRSRASARRELGLPDLLFFALFLGAAARWRLRSRLDLARR